MQRLIKELIRISILDEVAQVHNTNRVGDVLNNGQVMRDEQIGQTKLLLQVAQEVDDLRLNGNVKCGNRLIAENEIRIQRKRTSDTNSLTLTAGELMRIAMLMLLTKAASFHDAGDIIIKIFLRNDAVLTDCLADDLADGKSRRKAGIRILEDDLDGGALLTQFLLRQGEDLLAVEVYLTVGLLMQAQERSADRGLATAGLADKAHGRSASDLKGYSVDRLDVADSNTEETRLDREILLQILNNKQVFRIFFRIFEVLDKVIITFNCLFLCHITVPPLSQSAGRR